MNSNKRSESDMYNVSTYTDAELYDILDLSNPTDRELEAKIIYLYRKYKNMQNDSGEQLAKFFYDIHNRFFENDNESEDMDEDEDNNETIKEGMVTLKDAQKQQLANIDSTNNKKVTNDYSSNSRMFLTDTEIRYRGNASSNNVTTTSTYTRGQASSQKVNFIKQLDYTSDTGNPILKETVTRVISIDSQYRSDKNSLPTEFTFDLADPLKDVVSLSLYSIQIPYTWYTIAKSYGSNFFYIKGSSPGINNGNHDIQIAINPGNYEPAQLVEEVKNSIKNNYSLYTDISFGSTSIGYNAGNSRSYMEIGITKQYGENSYHLNFPDWTTPNLYDDSGFDDVIRARNSIPAFLGLNQDNYQLNTINSGLFTSAEMNTNDNLLYRIDPLSATITVIKYTSIINKNSKTGDLSACLYTPDVTPVDLSFSITLSLLTDGTRYKRSQILADLSNQIYNSTYLSKESSVKLISINNSDDIRNGNSYYQLKLKPDRYKTNNITNSKIFLQFPNESNIASNNTKIWTGNTSCFRFKDLSNEMQLLTGETPIVKQTKLYPILQGPYVELTCVNPNFISVANDISFSLQLNQETGSDIYTIPQMIQSINAGIVQETINKPFLNGPSSLSYNYDQTRSPSNTIAFVDSNNNFSLAVDVEKLFDNKNYTINFTDTSFNSVFNLGNDNYGNPVSNSALTGLIGVRGTFDRITINNNSVLFYIDPMQDMCGNELDNIGPIIYNDASNNFTDYNTLSTKITNYLKNYTYKGNTIFTADTIFNITEINSQQISVSLNLYINRKIIAKDYSIRFIDNVNPNSSVNNYLNFWADPLNINTATFISHSFDLSNNSAYLTKYSDTEAIAINGSMPIEIVTINFASISNKFTFIADEDGVETTLGTNNIVITVPVYDLSHNLIYYTRDMLISKLNSLLAENPLSAGSYLYLTQPDSITHFYYLKMRININKIYRAIDYKIVFYDTISFVKCFAGAKGVQNTTWDSTLGWILGFRNSTYYILNDPVHELSFDYNTSFQSSSPEGIYSPDSNNIIAIVGDTGVSTNLYNYFLICLNDYNLNRLDDGLVTITGQDTSVPLPSYADRSQFQCDPVTEKLTYNANTREYYSQLTQNQLYALAQKSNAKNSVTSNILGGESYKAFGRGPFSDDVFAVIPMKLAGLKNGQYFVEFGGTLQNNNRYYFGPVNIHRMSVKIISDKGNTVDLNGANWSFSFICQQLYKQKK